MLRLVRATRSVNSMRTAAEVNKEIITKMAALESSWLSETIKRDLRIQIDTLKWVLGEIR